MRKLVLAMVVVFASMATVNAQINVGLQAEYLLDGSIIDNYNSNDLTSSGSTVYGSNRLNQQNTCFSFGGSTELICPLDLTALSSKSISLWFRTDQPGGLIGHDGASGNAPILYIGTNGLLSGKFFDGSTGSVSNSNTVLTDLNWHHVVITASPTGQMAYLDNQLVGTTSSAPTNLLLSNTTIGNVIASGWPSAPSNTNFSGQIDDVRIYDNVISSVIVDSLYNYPVWQSPYSLDTLYVDINATGANDGSSWADAYTDARDAFIYTTPNAEIWVAQGTYIKNSTDRNTVFGWDKDSIRVYGGFIGNETMRDQRDWIANPTIFSGDIGVAGDNSDNAYTTFVGPIGDVTFALIDGVKITGGNSDGNSYPDYNTVGGAMNIDTEVDHIVIKNVEVYGNYAREGAAFSAYGASGEDCRISLENVIAHNNIGSSCTFGHFRASAVASIILEMSNCLIYANNSVLTNTDKGTVLFLGGNANVANALDATITNCTFANNNFTPGHPSKGMIRLYNQTNAPSSLTFTNNICYGNDIVEITSRNSNNVSEPFPTVVLNNNILENGIDFTATTNNNAIISDPLFNNDYSLQTGSPAIDAGTTVGVTIPLIDLAGNNRINGLEIDLGAYEYSSASTNSLSASKKEKIKLYPNPAVGNISIEGVDEKVDEISINNINGQKVLSVNQLDNINVSQLPKGVYIIHIETELNHYSLRFIKK